MANTVFKKQMLMEFKRLLMSSNTLKMLPFNFYITVFAYLKLGWTGPQAYTMAVVGIIMHNNSCL